jgi:hypothetical protein
LQPIMGKTSNFSRLVCSLIACLNTSRMLLSAAMSPYIGLTLPKKCN